LLIGTNVTLRPVVEDDLGFLQGHSQDLEERGPWYPLPRRPLAKLRAAYEGDGFWAADEGIFMIEADGRLIGHISWGRLNGDIPDMELGYRVYSPDDRGKGYATEAVVLMSRYLFDTDPMNRASMVIHIDNVASQRVAEKAGFTQEVRAREAWPHKGGWHDVFVYSVTRREFAARWESSRTAAKGSIKPTP